MDHEAQSSAIDVVLLSPPTPYEYALMSQLIYTNFEEYKGPRADEGLKVSQKSLDAMTEKEREEFLGYLEQLTNKETGKGWRLEKFVSLNDGAGYIGGIWVNDKTKQVVIAHRGSQNLDSWLTDVRTIVDGRPGEFVYAALNMLRDPVVLECRKKRYRLSTTGHSLGGFLAQICVYWAQRSEHADTYYPEMSAVTYDSPGALDFMEVLQSNLEAEKRRIDPAHLNIHNFCAMTVVSTFGRQAGTLWHLYSESTGKVAFFDEHRLGNLLKHGFDSGTGKLISYRQMLDWPQADYTAYSSMGNAALTLASAAAKAPFNILNELYKNIRKVVGRPVTETAYEQIFGKKEGQVSRYLAETSGTGAQLDPSILAEHIELAINTHYIAPATKAANEKRLDIHHFDPNIQVFLSEHELASYLEIDIGWERALKTEYGELAVLLLNSFDIKREGTKSEVVLKGYPDTVFDFQTKLLSFLQGKSLPSFKKLIAKTIETHGGEIESLKLSLAQVREGSSNATRLQSNIGALEAEVFELRKLINEITPTSAVPRQNVPIYDDAAVAGEEDAIAAAFLEAATAVDTDRLLRLIDKVREHDNVSAIFSRSAYAQKKGGIAFVAPANTDKDKLAVITDGLAKIAEAQAKRR